ncbi:MAG: hypothetical protein JXA20_16505 [Spirochaetes bacterium]|nr:hypothetical protein [Spirochaetota bacterium]
MKLFGVSIILLLGILNLVLVALQLLGGLRILKIPFKVHRTCGILLAVSSVLHGILAMAAQG